MVLRFQGIGADSEQMRHRMSRPESVYRKCYAPPRNRVLSQGAVEYLERLATTQQPSITVLREGGYRLLGKAGDDKAIVRAP